MKFIAVVAGIIVFSYWAVGRAADIELARAGANQGHNSVSVMSAAPGQGALSERDTGQAVTGARSDAPVVGETPTASRSESVPPPVQLEQPGYRWQGKTARWWAKRAVQQRKNSTARGRTIRRLEAELRRGFIPWYWLAVGSCESGLRWSYNGSSGYDGALQYLPGTWSANRLSGYPSFAWQASPFQQLVVAEIVLARSGWGQWPACSRKLGLR